MHFPLHKGTEVLLTFIDGDPDRPIIQAAVPNPETPSQLNSADQTMGKITTSGGNKIHVEDQEGSERVLMHVPNKSTFLRIGAPNDPDDPPDSASAEWDGCAIATAGVLHFKAEAKNEFIVGESISVVGGLESSTVIGESLGVTAVASHEFAPVKWSYSATDNELKEMKTQLTNLKNELKGSHNSIAENINSIAQSKVQALNLDTKLSDLHTAVTNERTQAITTATSALATKQDVTAAKDEAVGAANKAIGEQSKAIGSQMDALAEKTTAVASKVETLGSHLKTAVESTHNIAVKTDVHAEQSKLAGLYSVL
jgi:type VI secretion system secreted protein VgrG